MKGAPLNHAKKSWDGQMERRALLAAQGIELPDTLDDLASKVPPDDILDAASTAWTAWRHVRGRVNSLPNGTSRASIADRELIWF